MERSRVGGGVETDVSAAVIEGVADAEGVSPTELDPLYDVVDPDALDRLFGRTGVGERTTGRVEFVYHGYAVTVHGDGRVEIDPKESGAGGTD